MKDLLKFTIGVTVMMIMMISCGGNSQSAGSQPAIQEYPVMMMSKQDANMQSVYPATITQPLFAKKQLTGNLKIAKAQQQEALLTFEQTVLEAGQEVTDILYAFEASLRKNETRQKQITASRNSVVFTQELLKAGVANYTEVLNAEQNLLSAQLSQVNDRLEQLQCTVNLYKALGGGVE